MVERYGFKVEHIFTLIEARPQLAAPIIGGLPFCQAELEYCARHEMAQTTEDVLRRRIPLLLLARSEQLMQVHHQLSDYFDD